MTTPIHPDEDPMNVAGFVLPDVPRGPLGAKVIKTPVDPALLYREPLFDCFEVVEEAYELGSGELRLTSPGRSRQEVIQWVTLVQGYCEEHLRETIGSAKPGTYYYTLKFIIVCVA